MEEESKRKMGRKSYGGYKLISIKDPGGPWVGVLWVKAKSLKEIDALPFEEQNKRAITKCPFGVPPMIFPTDYSYVRSECKYVSGEHELHGEEDRNCVFLFRYADTGDYNCRLRVKSDKERVYDRRFV